MILEINNAEMFAESGGNVVRVEMDYPKATNINTVEVGVTAVRAVDNIRVHFDFDRDGWVITQPQRWHTPHPTEPNVFELQEEWVEAAFCPAWQFELEKSEGEKLVLWEDDEND